MDREARLAVYAQHHPLTILHAVDGSEQDWRTGSTWSPPGCAFDGGVSWSPDGSRIALPGVVLDTGTWTARASLALDDGHSSDAIAFSPDGTRIAGGSRPRAGGQVGCICLVVWDPTTGEQVLALDAPGSDGYRAYISGVAWRPDGRRVLTTAWWGPTGVFDLAAKKLALELPRAASAAWSPDGTRIVLSHAHDPWVTEDAPGVVSVVDAATGAVLLERTVLEVPIRAVAWHPAGHRIAVGATDGTVALLAADTLATVEVTTVLGPVSVVRFGPDGVSVAVGTGAGVVHLLPASLAAAGVRAPVGLGEVVATAWSPDGQLLASGGIDGVVAVRRAGDGVVVAELAAPERVQALAWRHDGERLAVAAAGITLYDTTTWERVGAPAADAGIGWPESMAYGPDGTTLAVMTRSGVHLVDLTTMDAVWGFSPWETAGVGVVLEGFSWSPAGTELVLATEGGELWFVDPGAEDEPGYRRVPTALAAVQALAHSADGSLLVFTGPAADGDELRVAVLETATLDVRHDVTFANAGRLTAAAGFTKEDGWFWAAGTPYGCGCPGTAPGEGDVVKAWSVADGKRVFGLANPRHAGAAAFSPDGTRVVVGSLTGVLSSWAVP
jgi:WD40 repeat protein